MSLKGWRLVLCACVLAGCQAKPPIRPVSAVPQSVVDVASRTWSVTVDRGEETPQLACRARLTEEQSIKQSVVETLMREGDWYAALAQSEGLPAQVTTVALLKADILRTLSPERAKPLYEAVLSRCKDVRAEHGLALIAASEGRLGDALQGLKRVTRAFPAEPRYRNDLGVIYLQLQQDDDAAFELRTAHELAKADPQPVFNLMLRALVRNDQSDWMNLSARWAPPVATRERLAEACATLMIARLGGQRMRCPIDPRRT